MPLSPHQRLLQLATEPSRPNRRPARQEQPSTAPSHGAFPRPPAELPPLPVGPEALSRRAHPGGKRCWCRLGARTSSTTESSCADWASPPRRKKTTSEGTQFLLETSEPNEFVGTADAGGTAKGKSGREDRYYGILIVPKSRWLRTSSPFAGNGAVVRSLGHGPRLSVRVALGLSTPYQGKARQAPLEVAC